MNCFLPDDPSSYLETHSLVIIDIQVADLFGFKVKHEPVGRQVEEVLLRIPVHDSNQEIVCITLNSFFSSQLVSS